MAQSANGKVIPMVDHPRARARLSPKESADVLTGCRELALQRIASALSGMLDRVEDDLFDLADKASDREAQNAYLEARTQAREKRSEIEGAFKRHFVDFFNQRMKGDAPARGADPAGTELSLVGDEDLEERLAVREMAKKLHFACEGELGALSQRMGFLLEKPELDDDANPVSPASICAALKDACDQIQSGFRVRMTLLHQLEQHTADEMQRIYHDLNSHLVERRILPDVRPGIPRAVRNASRPRKDSKVQGAGGATAQATGPGSAAAPTDILAALAQLIDASRSGAGSGASSAGASAGAQAAGAGPAGAPSWPTAPGASSAPPTVPQSFMNELTRMHREDGAASVSTEDALVNVIKRIKAAPQSSTLGTVDAMTIDIVGMLFDYIFEDRHIPSSVKALLGRLQIPTLKVALLDKSFFSSKSHPARRLLDLLAAAALGVEETGPREAPTLKFIESIVESVLAEFDTDLALFERLAEKVSAFIEEQKQVESSVVERSARLIEERERDEIALMLAEEEISRRLAVRAWVPPPVREMIDETWARALARVQRAEGEGSPAWQALLLTMENLLWSVEPKATPEDRKRLITMLPGMIKSLQEGMQRGELADERRDAFLGLLVDCHAMAVKAGLRGIAALPEAKAPELWRKPEIARAVVPAGDVQVEEIRLRAPKGAAPVRNVFTRTGIWTNLQRGTWVQFSRPDAAPMRARLTWISPNKGVYLFTNSFATNAAVSITPEALAEQMRLGEVRVIDDAPLVERAVDSMLADLRQG